MAHVFKYVNQTYNEILYLWSQKGSEYWTSSCDIYRY